MAGLRQLHAAGKLGFHGGLAALAPPAAFAALLRGLFRSDWVVYAKRPFGGAEHALRYLGCYTHRVAISNHSLVALEDGEVVFRWRDSALNRDSMAGTIGLIQVTSELVSMLVAATFTLVRNSTETSTTLPSQNSP